MANEGWVGRTPAQAVNAYLRKVKLQEPEILELMAADVEVRAVQTVRKRSHKTAQSMGHRVTQTRSGWEGVVFNTHFVSRFLEFGTSKMQPYPFLRPAAEEVIPGGSVARYFARKLQT